MKTSGRNIKEVINRREITIKFDSEQEFAMFKRLMSFSITLPEIVYDDCLREPLGKLMSQISEELRKLN